MINTNGSRRIISVILAAGKGTRMNTPYLHKVCFPVDGKPAIARSIELYKRCGIDAQMVVVGSMAEQVMQAACTVPTNLSFCFQQEQKGTGNAAKVAARILEATGYDGDVLVVAGDKVIEESVILNLISKFRESDCDLAFVVGNVSDFPSSGRIICDNGKILGNVEIFDIARMQLLKALKRIASERLVTPREAESLALSYLKREKKAALALGPLWDVIKEGRPITSELLDANFLESDFELKINDVKVTPKMLEDVRYANLSVYLFKSSALYDAINSLTSDNAQQEEYLTDVIAILSARNYKLQVVPIDYPQQVMAFNTQEELQKIQEYLDTKRKITVSEEPRFIRLASEWLKDFESADVACMRYLSDIYGLGNPVIEGKRRTVAEALRDYIERYGDEETIITRSPGRINVMGRHVDHQGGNGNVIAIDRDVFFVIGKREDREIFLGSVESHLYPDRKLNIDELVEGYSGESWLDFVNSDFVTKRISETQGDWSHYVAAPIARFQTKFSHRPLCGMNIMTTGDIPVAAGLSSSSAIVVAVAEGLVALNQIDVTPENFVELCGEGEWYVGTRGGANDHAAMKFARRGQVTQVGFFPFGIIGAVDFPADYNLVVFNSHEKARKTQGAKDIFNHRVACYNIGREILKKTFTKYAPAIQHLRDFNTRNLGVSYPELLEMLKRLPMNLSRREVEDILTPEQSIKYLSTHSKTFDNYPIRPVVMYGLAECERSRNCAALLSSGAIDEFGKWMNISHDGDRVVKWDKKGNSWPFEVDYSDESLDKLINDAKNGEASASLVMQPGAYSCSIPQIDQMVDIALSVSGVLGAQLSGAGLGGCIMVLVHKDSCDDVQKAMVDKYYSPSNLEPAMFVCSPVAGSGPICY